MERWLRNGIADEVISQSDLAMPSRSALRLTETHTGEQASVS